RDRLRAVHEPLRHALALPRVHSRDPRGATADVQLGLNGAFGCGAKARSLRCGASPPEAPMSDAVQPFRIQTSDGALDERRRRLRGTRWPERECVDDWSQGTPLSYVQDVCAYWAEKYDWRERERRLNAFPQFRTTLEGLGIHFYHVRSKHPDALPI